MSISEPFPPSPASALRDVVAFVHVESPHVVRYKIFVRPPGASQFQEVASGTQPGGEHSLGNLPSGAEVGGSFNVAGTPNTAYRIRFGCEADGIPVTKNVSGTTDENGADARREIVRIP